MRTYMRHEDSKVPENEADAGGEAGRTSPGHNGGRCLAPHGLVAIGYVASFTLLALVLRQGMPLGAAYGIWGAMGVATTAVMSALIFGESLTWIMGAGIVLIIGGVLAVELGSHTGHQNKEGVA